MIHRTPFVLPLLYPSLTWRMPSETKTLYLTFDDGPVTGPTEFVLETLRKSRAHATFFCIGENITKHPKVFNQIIDQGHAIGNHTYNHVNGWQTNARDYCENVRRCEREIASHGLTEPSGAKLFRPPYGRVTRKQIKILPDYKIVMWDVLSVDYNKNLLPEKCLKNTIAATRAGSIIVFHDSFKAEKNLVFALPRFIDHFLQQGFVFRKLKFEV